MLKENRDATHFTQVQGFEDEPPVQIGTVSRISLNPSGTMLAVYANALEDGLIHVLDDTLDECKNTLATYCKNADDLNWCGNDSIVLTVGKTLWLVGPEEK